MPTLKNHPRELALHGGGLPAFDAPLAAFAPHVGDGRRFASLAEAMFVSGATAGEWVATFESELAAWMGVRNVVGFSGVGASARLLRRVLNLETPLIVSSLGSELAPLDGSVIGVDSESRTLGLDPVAASRVEVASGVLAIQPCGRPNLKDDLQTLCEERDWPLLRLAHQGLWRQGHEHERAQIFELGRDQILHALHAAVISTDDDLLAHRLRSIRGVKLDGADPCMSDAVAVMGIANLESIEDFADENRRRHGAYRELLAGIPGISLLSPGPNFHSVTIQVDPTKAGVTREGLRAILVSENVGVARPFLAPTFANVPVACDIAGRLLQLPTGPTATEEAIEAVCRLVELAIVQGLEAPDPIRLAA